ncbi:unnamed protein product [Didymodactylos carnosus]|uniref:G-protein coupled receptors family 1 profile domain-containing protein n=1 Tax=Didymodactylos carnosus TaxID=1234261 RepID=A0A813YT98_9BILA|nr:unnamed protein product [Didymodactylos carnosus]CAF0888763.1 unnamed protein product [Didymodactylos carnosus]CAF3536849.1 unnamed protein product [Didymodactylos carnosus]CAF3673507.1 unnamed protein product [Didymodactylos carnosus]
MMERDSTHNLNGTANNYSSHLSERFLFDHYDNIDQQELTALFQQMFSKIITTVNETQQYSSVLPRDGTSALVAFLPSALNDKPSSLLWSRISLWFVLIINPILIFLGVIGNFLATYILIRCKIATLSVTFYTVMLNISDTLNLLIPVFIFWLDNCVNRKGDKGYFRDKSNFLCKALMCSDQLFAALSAWYMCAISFNRWRSVCRPSTFYMNNNNNKNNNNKRCTYNSNSSHRKQSSSHMLFSILHPQNLKSFRSIAIITVISILLSCIPIFFHELRPVMSSDAYMFNVNKIIGHTHSVIWKRCYYSHQHERIYDVIGILLSIILHIIPLTVVAGMNIMIITRLHHRHTLSTSSIANPVKHLDKKNLIIHKEQKSKLSIDIQEPICAPVIPLSMSLKRQQRHVSLPYLQKRVLFTGVSLKRSKTDKKMINHEIDYSNVTIDEPQERRFISRHCSRDRTITIMLVSVAVSYLVLTLPYRLLWISNVWVKRSYPERLSSTSYAWKMHYIDHFLRTVRNIHFATNFIFFILLSKAFREKFRQLFIDKFKSIISNQPNNNNNNNNNMDVCTNIVQSQHVKGDYEQISRVEQL